MKFAIASFAVVSLVWVGMASFVASTATKPQTDTLNATVAPPKQAAQLRLAKVRRGNILTTISATGTVKPQESVEVGAQLTGMITAFGKDADGRPFDFGSVVRKGDVLAMIDDTIYSAQLDSAKAALVRAEADLTQLRARCAQAKHDAERAESLRPDHAIAVSDYEMAMTNFQVAEANVAVGEAAIQQCQAGKKIAETNLDHTIIRSPIDGVIIDRRIDIGQTVVISFFNSPGLFLIAKDLKRMQVWASVKETDISRVHRDMPVRFTVDARPGETFEGKVDHVRLNATKAPAGAMFTVVVNINNSRDMLPYLTANLQFEIERHPNVLFVPNDALQEPEEPLQAAVDASAAPGSSAESRGDKNPSGSSKPLSELAAKAKTAWSRLLVKVGNSVQPIEVQVGTSDGAVTEIVGDSVKEGAEVVLGELAASDGA